MNSTSLLALVVDQHAGELAPEVAELLEAYLSESPPARAEAERIRKTLAVTEETILRHPELARVPVAHSGASRASSSARSRFAPALLAKAASIALLAVLSGAGGFFAGQKNSAPPANFAAPVSDDAARPPRKDSPWARYRFASDRDGGGMKIVRVDSGKLAEGTLQ